MGLHKKIEKKERKKIESKTSEFWPLQKNMFIIE